MKYSCQILLSEDNDKYGRFVCCVYEYCDTLVHEPELIDNLYCSLMCKKLDLKDIVTTEEPITKSKEITNSKKPIIDRKQLLEKLENRIHKRKQSLTSSNSGKKFRNYSWNELEQLENSRPDLPLDENQSLNIPYDISSPEAENDDNGGNSDDDENSTLLNFKVYLY